MSYYNKQFPHVSAIQQQKVDPQKFRQLAHNLNDGLLNQLAQRARLQGISEEDIQKGIEIIHNM